MQAERKLSPLLVEQEEGKHNVYIKYWHELCLGMPVAASLPRRSYVLGTVTMQFLGNMHLSIRYVIPGLEGSCAATAGCCENTACASAGRPKSHSQPTSVASAGLGYAVQMSVLPKAGCQLAVVSAP